MVGISVPASVVDDPAGAQQHSLSVLGAAISLDTLLGPETTPVVVLVLLRARCGVVAPSWWWGVVFVYWIVVASI